MVKHVLLSPYLFLLFNAYSIIQLQIIFKNWTSDIEFYNLQIG